LELQGKIIQHFEDTFTEHMIIGQNTWDDNQNIGHVDTLFEE
jgi:hypothetical protein